MIIIPQKVELLKHDIHPYKFIEKVARTCYKSEDKITDDSAEKMVAGLCKSGHYAMLEHEYLYFNLSFSDKNWWNTHISYEDAKFLHIDSIYVSGSLRAFKEFFEKCESEYSPYADGKMLIHAHRLYPLIFGASMIENDVDEDGAFLWDDKEAFINDMKDCFADKAIMKFIPHTLKFTTSRAIANELVRHRLIVAAQESQRYVDYSKDKMDNQITVIEPLIHPTDILNYENWHYAMVMAECQYMNLRKGGMRPEIARGVLPNDCKTEIVVTATEEEWQHIINLRYHGTTGTPHPQMRELMQMAYPILQEESNGRIQ